MTLPRVTAVALILVSMLFPARAQTREGHDSEAIQKLLAAEWGKLRDLDEKDQCFRFTTQYSPKMRSSPPSREGWVKRIGPSLLVRSDGRESSGIVARNPAYEFEIGRKSKDTGWILKQVRENSGSEKDSAFSDGPIMQRVFPLSLIASANFENFIGKGANVLSKQPFEGGLIRIEIELPKYTSKESPGGATSRAIFIADPAQHYCVKKADFVIDGKLALSSSRETVIEQNTDQLICTKLTYSLYSLRDGSVQTEFETQFHDHSNNCDVSPGEFRLTHYGLQEPINAPPLPRNFSSSLIFALAAVSVAGVALIVWRRRGQCKQA